MSVVDGLKNYGYWYWLCWFIFNLMFGGCGSDWAWGVVVWILGLIGGDRSVAPIGINGWMVSYAPLQPFNVCLKGERPGTHRSGTMVPRVLLKRLFGYYFSRNSGCFSKHSIAASFIPNSVCDSLMALRKHSSGVSNEIKVKTENNMSRYLKLIPSFLN